MSKNTRNRILLTAVAALLLVAVAVGGTMAWLQASTNQVVNTFEPTSLSVDLEETGTDTDNKKNYTMVPGAELSKDPTVDYSSDVHAYVFIEVIENGGNVTVGTGDDAVTYDFADFIEYSVVAGWLRLDGDTTNRKAGVYYKEIDVTNGAVNETDVVIIEDATGVDNQVTVLESVTKEMMNALKENPSEYPTLSFQAYIIQADNLTSNGAAVSGPAAAWAIVNP